MLLYQIISVLYDINNQLLLSDSKFESRESALAPKTVTLPSFSGPSFTTLCDMEDPSIMEQTENSADSVAHPDFSELPEGAVHFVFSFLGPRDLCAASAVCKSWRDLNRDASANRVWHEHYSKRWRAPPHNGLLGWQAQYSKKMRSAQSFSSKGLVDILYGHTAAVHSTSLLPTSNLIATGSADNTVRLWDLGAGIPLASSRPLKGSVRAVSLDEQLLVCGGSHDGALRLWRAQPGTGATKFNLQVPTRLSGHTGPVVSLALDSRNIYSGSWDCTVRIWNRETLRREALLAFPDWVNTAKPRGRHLLVTAGSVLHIHSLATGQAISQYKHTALAGALHWEEGRSTAPLQVDGSHDGRMVFLAGADGAIILLDLRVPRHPAAVLSEQNSPVRDLRFEDPWIAAATYNGALLLLDADAIVRDASVPDTSTNRWLQRRRRTVRQRLTGGKGPAFCVDIADNWLACGSADQVVRTWDFQQAEKEAAQRSATAPRRRRRGTRKQRNRFPFIPDSGSSDTDEAEREEGEAALASSCQGSIPLSQSLPAHLGGYSAQTGIQSMPGDSCGSHHASPTASDEDSGAESCSVGEVSPASNGSEGRAASRDNDRHSQPAKPSSGRFRVSVPLPVRPGRSKSGGASGRPAGRGRLSKCRGKVSDYAAEVYEARVC